MKDICIIYGSHGSTKDAAERIRDAFGENRAECRDIEEISADEIGRYDHLVLGTPTINGDLPEEWKKNFGKLHIANLEGKQVAIFGLGDQNDYPDRFADAMGVLAKEALEKGARLVGKYSSDQYSFQDSAALDHGENYGPDYGYGTHKFPPEGKELPPEESGTRFVGLVLDEERQHERTETRIKHWVEDLNKEFRL